ncbi:hypothetical protein Btru_068219 [Bulinus truncatus]|nr:hypothetical protein Btru_068219 [Bulinus truncatus]
MPCQQWYIPYGSLLGILYTPYGSLLGILYTPYGSLLGILYTPYGSLLGILYTPYGSLLGILYTPYGSLLGILYTPYGSLLGILYTPYGSLLGILYTPYGSLLGILYTPYGSLLGILYTPYGSLLGILYTPYGSPPHILYSTLPLPPPTLPQMTIARSETFLNFHGFEANGRHVQICRNPSLTSEPKPTFRVHGDIHGPKPTFRAQDYFQTQTYLQGPRLPSDPNIPTGPKETFMAKSTFRPQAYLHGPSHFWRMDKNCIILIRKNGNGFDGVDRKGSRNSKIEWAFYPKLNEAQQFKVKQGLSLVYSHTEDIDGRLFRHEQVVSLNKIYQRYLPSCMVGNTRQETVLGKLIYLPIKYKDIYKNRKWS